MIGLILALIMAIAIWTVGFVLWKKGRIRYKTHIYLFMPLGVLCFVILVFLETAEDSIMCRLTWIISFVLFAFLMPSIMAHFLRLVMGVDIRRYYYDDEEKP